jgi:hypothetical protein
MVSRVSMVSKAHVDPCCIILWIFTFVSTIMDTDTYYCRMMVDCAGMPHGRVTPVHGHQMDEIMNHAR